jgi:hypothetical protein
LNKEIPEQRTAHNLRKSSDPVSQKLIDLDRMLMISTEKYGKKELKFKRSYTTISRVLKI